MKAPAPISFARGAPSIDIIAVDALRAAADRALRDDPAGAFSYGTAAGYPPLRDWIAEQHDVDPARVVVTNGSLQGFHFVARHFVERGTRFFVEAPCYDRSLAILRRLGADAREIELADDGLDVDALARELRSGDLVYTIPTFQNPSGRTLSRENRGHLLDLAREREAVIFEDDPYGQLRFEGDELPRLFELAGGEGVLFLSSFSKTVAPGIRTGYLILPKDLVPDVEAQVLTSYVSPAIFVEAALHEFLALGRFEPNLERIRSGLHERRDAMLGALTREFPDAAAWNQPEGGYFLWVDLPAGVDAASLAARASEQGVQFVKGSDFYLATGGEESARLAFSYATPPEIGEGIARLGRLVRQAAAVPA